MNSRGFSKLKYSIVKKFLLMVLIAGFLMIGVSCSTNSNGDLLIQEAVEYSSILEVVDVGFFNSNSTVIKEMYDDIQKAQGYPGHPGTVPQIQNLRIDVLSIRRLYEDCYLVLASISPDDNSVCLFEVSFYEEWDVDIRMYSRATSSEIIPHCSVRDKEGFFHTIYFGDLPEGIHGRTNLFSYKHIGKTDGKDAYLKNSSFMEIQNDEEGFIVDAPTEFDILGNLYFMETRSYYNKINLIDSMSEAYEYCKRIRVRSYDFCFRHSSSSRAYVDDLDSYKLIYTEDMWNDGNLISIYESEDKNTGIITYEETAYIFRLYGTGYSYNKIDIDTEDESNEFAISQELGFGFSSTLIFGYYNDSLVCVGQVPGYYSEDSTNPRISGNGQVVSFYDLAELGKEPENWAYELRYTDTVGRPFLRLDNINDRDIKN